MVETEQRGLANIATTLRALPEKWEVWSTAEFDRLPSDKRGAIQQRWQELLAKAGLLVIKAILDFGWLPGESLEIEERAHWARGLERNKPYERGAIKFFGMFVDWLRGHPELLRPGANAPDRLKDLPNSASREGFAAACEAISWLVSSSAPSNAAEAPRTGLALNGEWSAPMTRTEIARRITGEHNTRPRKVQSLLDRFGLEQVNGKLFRVRLDLMDAATRKKIEQAR